MDPKKYEDPSAGDCRFLGTEDTDLDWVGLLNERQQIQEVMRVQIRLFLMLHGVKFGGQGRSAGGLHSFPLVPPGSGVLEACVF